MEQTEESMMPKGELPDLTRREFVQVGASVVAVVASSKAWSSTPTLPARDFEHGNPLSEFGYGDVHFAPSPLTGKSGWLFGFRNAFIVEPQHFPDSPNQSKFPSTVLKPGEVYKNT